MQIISVGAEPVQTTVSALQTNRLTTILRKWSHRLQTHMQQVQMQAWQHAKTVSAVALHTYTKTQSHVPDQ